MLATSVRFFAAPVFFVALLADIFWADVICATLFLLASLTDWLDGYWARKYDARTTLGKFMDPIADKILVLSALVVLLHLDRVDPVMVTFLISRDIFIGGIRSASAADGLIIDAKPTGKVKTALQMLAIPCLFLEEVITAVPLHDIGYYSLWFSVFLSYIG
jgi:CDP-diacylglycerol--glycerol-3-phosphate 3-phosphatidyltransferase